MKKIPLLKILVTTFALLAGFTASSQATTYTWGGNASSTWNTAANWIGGVVPPSSDNSQANFETPGSVTVSFNNSARTTGSVYLLAAATGTTTIDLQTNRTFNLSKNGTVGEVNLAVGSGNLTFIGNGTASIGLLTNYNFNNAGSGTLSISPIISGVSKSITLIGSGKTVFSGANTYTGGTTVSVGTLLVNNASGSGTGTGAVSVASGATLGGNGTISGATTINSGANLALGNSPGILSFGSTLTLAGNATMEINGLVRGTDFDGINTTGLLTYGGALSLNFGAATGIGNTYDLFQIGAGSYTGSFASVSLGGLYSGNLTNSSGVWSGTNGGFAFTFTESTGDLGITAVPEPATWALLAFSLTTVMVFRRRRA